ncbi:hypothetical protein GGF32_004835 [Allomyces javanicus]|nr:hypothetical protein GGF32_004835 [Allomyces javanicus]
MGGLLYLRPFPCVSALPALAAPLGRGIALTDGVLRYFDLHSSLQDLSSLQTAFAFASIRVRDERSSHLAHSTPPTRADNRAMELDLPRNVETVGRDLESLAAASHTTTAEAEMYLSMLGSAFQESAPGSVTIDGDDEAIVLARAHAFLASGMQDELSPALRKRIEIVRDRADALETAINNFARQRSANLHVVVDRMRAVAQHEVMTVAVRDWC